MAFESLKTTATDLANKVDDMETENALMREKLRQLNNLLHKIKRHPSNYHLIDCAINLMDSKGGK